MEENKRGRRIKDTEETRATDEDVSLQGENLSRKRRVQKRKREEEAS